MQSDECIERIRSMERRFNEVRAALQAGTACALMEENIRRLEAYMDGGTWLEDYQRDERGELPSDLKRGVLSEDALYNLLDEINRQRRKER